MRRRIGVMITMTRINGILQPVMLCNFCHKCGDRSDHTAVALFDTPADLFGR
jgi:hypothetical protein